MRKYFLNDEENGYLLKRVEKQTAQPNAFDPSMMTEMLKGNMLNMIPMIFIGGWINWTFSGFVTTRVCWNHSSLFYAPRFRFPSL